MRTEPRWRLTAFFGALTLFFSTLEYLFPRPVPFFRIGLSNLPALAALPLFTIQEQLWLLALKVLGQGLVNGTLTSYVFLFSAAGSMASFLVMIALDRLSRRSVLVSRHLSLVGISLAGALASNAVQIALSMTFLFGAASGIIAPLLFGLGTLGGLAVGWAAQIFVRHSRWWKRLAELCKKGKAE